MNKWWWLSFGCEDTGKFLGVAIISAPDFYLAHMQTHFLNLNPGGQILAYEITQAIDEIKKADRFRLLNKEEAMQYGVRLGQEEEE